MTRRSPFMQNWDLMRAFLALHRAGTFEAAAQLLCIDHSTLRRRIQILEEQLGSRLFSRTDGHYAVAPSVRPLLDAALQIEESSRLFFEGHFDPPSGKVRVSMIDMFATWMAPALLDFNGLFPDIELDISTEHHFVNLERELVDVAIRLARPRRGNCKMRRLADVRFGVYASSRYLDRRSDAETEEPHALLALALHFTRRDHGAVLGEAEWMLQHLPAGRVVCATDSYVLLRSYCEAGMGLALLPEFLGEQGQDLVHVYPAVNPACDLWLVMNPETFSSKRVRLFVDFISGIFKKSMPRRVVLTRPLAVAKPARPTQPDSSATTLAR
jgi:DNA-binding transcriptional LysR family regulator